MWFKCRPGRKQRGLSLIFNTCSRIYSLGEINLNNQENKSKNNWTNCTVDRGGGATSTVVGAWTGDIAIGAADGGLAGNGIGTSTGDGTTSTVVGAWTGDVAIGAADGGLTVTGNGIGTSTGDGTGRAPESGSGILKVIDPSPCANLTGRPE